jgi:hypothetical protein
MVDSILPLHGAPGNLYRGWFALCGVSPFTTFYRSLPQLPEQLQRKFATLDTPDTDRFSAVARLPKGIVRMVQMRRPSSPRCT